jgi:hypothetical protein
MNPQTLLTTFSVGLLASIAFPALAASQFEKQLQMTDGYTEPTAAPAPKAGAAGRPGKASSTKETMWFEKELKQTDGYTESAAVPASRPGAAGRPGKSSDDAWFLKQLKQSDGH